MTRAAASPLTAVRRPDAMLLREALEEILALPGKFGSKSGVLPEIERVARNALAATQPTDGGV